MNAEYVSKYEKNDDMVAGAYNWGEWVTIWAGFTGSLLKRRLTWLNLRFTWLFLLLLLLLLLFVGCKMSFF